MGLVASFEDDLRAAEAYHGHLCIGQFIGVRMARCACAELGIADPRSFRDLFVFVEVDRCLADALSVVTGCKLGKRRLKVIDYGKSAATFVNNATGEALRVACKLWVRTSEDLHSFFAKTSDSELFTLEKVKLVITRENLPGPPVEKVRCRQCGEYITDRRQREVGGRILCRACADGPYYTRISQV